MVEPRLLVAAAGRVERGADQRGALRAQPFDFLAAGPVLVEHARFFREHPARDLPRRKDEVPVIVALVALRRGHVQRQRHRHAPARGDGLGVLLQKLPARRERQPVRQRDNRLAAHRRVLPLLRLVHQLRELARRAAKVDARAAQHPPAALVIVGAPRVAIDDAIGGVVGHFRGGAVAVRARARRDAEMKRGVDRWEGHGKTLPSEWPLPRKKFERTGLAESGFKGAGKAPREQRSPLRAKLPAGPQFCKLQSNATEFA